MLPTFYSAYESAAKTLTILWARPTWGVKWGPFGDIVFYKDGRALVDQRFHAFRVALEGSQVQSGAALLVPDVQVHQGLQEHFQGLVVPIVGLQRGSQWHECSLASDPTAPPMRGEASKVTDRGHPKEHIRQTLRIKENTGNQRIRLKSQNAWNPQLCMNSFVPFLCCQIICPRGTECMNGLMYLYLSIYSPNANQQLNELIYSYICQFRPTILTWSVFFFPPGDYSVKPGAKGYQKHVAFIIQQRHTDLVAVEYFHF